MSRGYMLNSGRFCSDGIFGCIGYVFIYYH